MKVDKNWLVTDKQIFDEVNKWWREANCNVPPFPAKISACTTYPLQEKGTVSTSSVSLWNDLTKQIPYLTSCTSCKQIFNNIAPKGRRMSRSEEIHNEIKSILRRIFGSVFHEVGIKRIILNFLRKETFDDVIPCIEHRVMLLNQFFECSIKQYISFATAHLVSILKGKINYDFMTNVNAHILIIKASAKYKSSLKNQITLSTISKIVHSEKTKNSKCMTK